VLQARVRNDGTYRGIETVQLYIRDIAASLTRPVKELKSFKRVELGSGEATVVEFELTADDLAFYRRDGSYGHEPGKFLVWIATSSVGGLEGSFELTL
jgi:beta-glucosidase